MNTILCRKGQIRTDGFGYQRLFAELGETDYRGFTAGNPVRTSAIQKVDSDMEYTTITTHNNIYVVPTTQMQPVNGSQYSHDWSSSRSYENKNQ